MPMRLKAIPLDKGDCSVQNCARDTMNALLFALCISWLSLAFGQTHKSDGPHKDGPKKAEDTWERQKECLKFAEDDAARVAPTYKTDGTVYWTWSAHYSPKYGHCYAQIDAIQKNWKYEGHTFVSSILRDALENAVLASTMEQDVSLELNLPCRVPGKKESPCAESRAFIVDHMTN